MSAVMHWPRVNGLGAASLGVAVLGFTLNVISGVILFGWLLVPVGVALAMTALVAAPRRTRKEAVAALIVSLASVFAATAMIRDVVVPLLPV